MATYDELFGGSSGQRYMKFEEVGESFLLEQTGEPRLVPQKNQATGKNTWLVKFVGADKYKPMDEGDFDSDSDDVEKAFMPDKDVVIPVKVLGKKKKDGSKDLEFEEFDTSWELTRDQREKFKEVLLDSGQPAVAGVRYAVKLLSRAKKPYTYSIRMVTSD